MINKKFAVTWYILVFSVLVLFSEQMVFAQCGTYFKTNYRAVNKIGYINNGNFLLNDWTGDGRSDFWNFQLNPNTSTQNILIYPGKATGYWDWDNPIIYTTSIPSFITTINHSFVIKDFNSDGKIDILVNNLVIYRNNGNGTFTALAQIVLGVENYLEGLGFYDVNGDSQLDWINVIGVPQQGNSIGYHLGNADGTFGSRVSIVTNIQINNSTRAVGDFDGDGKVDITYGYFSGSGIYVYRSLKNLGGGNFEVGNITTYASGYQTRFLYTKDFNNDGKMDILADVPFSDSPLNGTPGKLVILYGQSNGVFVMTEYPVYNPGGYGAVRVTELNADNNPDIIGFGENFYSIYTNTGNGTFARADYQKSLAPTSGFNNLIIEDFSGDGKADIYNRSHGSYNTFGEEVVLIKENVCQSFGETKRANFDGDADADIARWNPNTGEWSSINGRWLVSVDTTVDRFNWGAGSLGDVPAPGDYDGDGKTDYTVYRNSTGIWYVFRSSDNSWATLQFGLTGDIPVPADYDGGGKTDFAVWRPSDGNWYIWFSETQQFGVVHFGANGDKPVPEDYDGDGKTDVAVYRPSEGNWYYLKSSDRNYAVIHWGIETDKPLPADYDGDGKADLTVFRNGDWYILRSMNNSFNFIHWGTSGDVPVPLYRNGDLAELVVYRPSNSYWYNYRQPGSALVFGGQQNILVYFGLPNN